MSIRDQLKSKLKYINEEEKRRKKEEKIKENDENRAYKKLKKESQHLIEKRLEEIILNASYDEYKWKFKSIPFEIQHISQSNGTVRKVGNRDFILHNNYEITRKDLKRFCRNNGLLIRYKYTDTENYISKTYISYHGESFREGLWTLYGTIYFEKKLTAYLIKPTI